MFGWALVRLWAAARARTFPAPASDGSGTARERLLRLADRPSKEIQRELGGLAPDGLDGLLGDLALVAAGAGTEWQDAGTAGALGEVLDCASLVAALTDGPVGRLEDALRREAHVLRGAAADLGWQRDEAVRQFGHATHGPQQHGTDPATFLGAVGRLGSGQEDEAGSDPRAEAARALAPARGSGYDTAVDAVQHAFDVRWSALETAADAFAAADPEGAGAVVETWLGAHDPSGSVELWRACAGRLLGTADEPGTAVPLAERLDRAFDGLHPDGFRDLLVVLYERERRPNAVVEVLTPLQASRPDDPDLAYRLAWSLRLTGDAAAGARLIRPFVADPVGPDDERVVELLAILLHESGSPEAARWNGVLAALRGDDGLASVMPTAGRPAFAGTLPLVARFEDGTLSVDPERAAALSPGQLQDHVTAAMVAGSPDGPELLRRLFAEAPERAAGVAELLGLRSDPGPHAPPSEADLLFREGEQHFERQDFTEAAGCYREALRLDPDHAAALLCLGDVHFLRKEFSAARAYFEESVAADETPMAWRFLGDTLRNLAEPTDRVRACYERALELDADYGGARSALDRLNSEGQARTDEGDTTRPDAPGTATTTSRSTLRAVLRRLRPGAKNRTALPPPERPASATASVGTEAPDDEHTRLSAAGIRFRLPHHLESVLRAREPSIAELLDALSDDEAMAAWQARWIPERLALALSTLSALSWQWNAKAGDTGRALLMARRQVQIVRGLPWQWLPHGSSHFAGRALLLSDALGTVASLLSDLGDYTEALAVLREAEEWLEADREERERTGRPLTGKLGGGRVDHDPREALYRQLAATAESAGDPETARHYDDLAEARRAGAPTSDHMRIAQLCAAALIVLPDDGAAPCFSYLDDALPLAVREAGWTPVEHALALVHHTRARALASLGLHRTALRHLARARNHNSGNADRLAEDWMLTAQCLAGRPALGDPLVAYERVLQLSGVPGSEPGDDPLVWRSRHGEGEPVRIENAARAWQAVVPMARAAWAADEAGTATDVLELGVEIADLVRAAQPDPELRRRLQDERAEVYELLVRYRLDGGDGRAAFAVTERLRSRTLLDSLSTAALRPPDGVPPELLAREASLLRERTELEQASRIDWARMHTVREELTRLWSEIAGQPAGRDYADIRSGTTIAADAALERLHGEQVVVASYGRLDDGRLVLFTLDPRTGTAVTPVDADGDRMLRFVADNLGGAGQVREMAEDLPDLFQQVLAPLVAPLADRLGAGDTALICPTGALHHVPFHALSPDGGPLLLERNAVAYLPSVSLLRTLDGRARPAGHGAVVVGDPGDDLPHARDEARLLAGRLGVAPLLGADATREQVLASMAGAEVLHAACHASFRSDDPLGSGLVLSDGLLTGRDILRQDWHGVRLAVLSACETGLGDVGRTDEALGLSRSLLFAGVRSLVMSLWRVPDRSTAALMADFHDLTLAGEPPAGALRTAMLAARERPGGSRLDQWAAFCLVGDWRSPTQEHRTRSVV
ncbi:CHAT domain-containing protein [Streptomyces sp. NPDC058221]|uniref:CHAT domain-containing protein n=1 Tax=Streptomyces sp. NPDC058221 TaxID=3346388 RepID=UPI0036E7C56B